MPIPENLATLIPAGWEQVPDEQPFQVTAANAGDWGDLGREGEGGTGTIPPAGTWLVSIYQLAPTIFEVPGEGVQEAHKWDLLWVSEAAVVLRQSAFGWLRLMDDGTILAISVLGSTLIDDPGENGGEAAGEAETPPEGEGEGEGEGTLPEDTPPEESTDPVEPVSTGNQAPFTISPFILLLIGLALWARHAE